MMNVTNILKNINTEGKAPYPQFLPNYIIATCITFTIFLCLFNMHVFGQENKCRQLKEAEIMVTEQSCRTELREQLNDMGYQNAGITINHIFEEEGNVSYHIELHHKKLNKLSAEATDNILNALSNQYGLLLGDNLQIYIR